MKKIAFNALISNIAENTNHSKKDIKEIYECLEKEILDELKNGNKVVLGNLGYFKTRVTAPRKGINPLTQTEISIPSKNVASFSFSKRVKDTLNDN